MEKNRIKRSKTINLKPIIITERDKALLARAADYRVLTTEQVFRLHFPSFGRARKRLFQLWQHGYLRRIVRPARIGEGTSMYLYLPGQRGLRLISSDHVIKQMPIRSSVFSGDHMLAVNDFRACIELATKSPNDIAIVSWKEGKQLLLNANIRSKVGIIKKVPIIPDGYFKLKHSEKEFHYFLEIDRGTTDLKRITLKYQGYLNIWNDKIAQTKLGIRSFRLLYVTVSDKRLTNMIEQLRKLKSPHHRLDLILLATANQFSLAKPSRLLEPIWSTLDSEANIQNVSLFPPTSFQSSRQRAENHHCAVQNPIPVDGTPGPGG
jgi:hypothetical protein